MAEKTIKFLLVGEDKSASKALRGVGDEAGKTQGKLSRMGEIAGGVLGADLLRGAADAVLDFAGASVDAASRAEQALGGVRAVFGEQAGQIERASEDAAKALGLSQTAYQDMATVLGAGLKNKGIEDFAEQSQNLLGIGADLAAQYGGDTKTAVEALASAMRGESDPIERYGVSLSESAVKAKLAEMGLDDLEGAALEQAKTQARLAIITEQTADAQGAFGRESETLAGKQQRLTAEFENAQSELGTMLLPVLTELAGVLTDVVTYVKENADWLGPLAAGFGLVTGAVLLTNAAMAANPIGLVVIAIAALVAGLVVAYNESETFRKIVDTAFRAIGDAGAWLWNNALQPALKAIVEGFAWVVDGLANMLEALGKIPGFGWASDAADKLRNLADKARSAASGINKIPDSKTVNIAANTASYDRAVNRINGRTLTTYVAMRVYGQGAVATGGYGGDVARAIGLVDGGMVRQRFNGVVTGPGTPTSDSVPAWLSRKEFVTNAAATDYYGTDVMYAMNARMIPREHFRTLGFAGGGTPSASAPAAGRSGPTIQITNYHPQAEPTSVTVNRGLQYAAAVGVI